MDPKQRRDHLVASALTLFGRRPHHHVLPEEVAAEAGVSRALFYHYFSSMDEVYVAALQVASEGLVARLLPPIEQPIAAQLEHVISELFIFGEQYRTPYIAMHRGHAVATPEAYTTVEQARTELIGQLADRAGIPAPTPLLTLTLRSWVSVLEGTVLAWLTQQTPDRIKLQVWLARQLRAMLAETATYDRGAHHFLAAIENSTCRGA